MVELYGKTWQRSELLSWIGDPQQISGARQTVIAEGQGEGVRAYSVNTGAGLSFTVLPGRGMDIAEVVFKGKPLAFMSPTGIASPAYFDKGGLEWLRTSFFGLLTTCGITYSGLPSEDQGEELGLHGRISNAAAENLSLVQDWEGDDFVISLEGTVRDAKAMFENMRLKRRVTTHLGWKKIRIQDRVRNEGFSPEPLMMIYHFNFGFPLVGTNARIVAPLLNVEARDEQASKDEGVKHHAEMPSPIPSFQEKAFYLTPGAMPDGSTFAAILNHDIGDGTPLGIVLRYNLRQLPKLTEWKMPRQGHYVLGIEPGTVLPRGRAEVRRLGELPLLEGQQEYPIDIEIEVLETEEEFARVEEESRTVLSASGRQE